MLRFQNECWKIFISFLTYVYLYPSLLSLGSVQKKKVGGRKE